MKKNLKNILLDKMSDSLKVKLFALTNVPLLLFISPKVIKLDDSGCIISVPLNKMTKNHLGSMYFGTLCMGADLASGLTAKYFTDKENVKISLSFKSVKGVFIQRVMGETHFSSNQGAEIKEFCNKVINSDIRHNMMIKVYATCPKIDPKKVVAEFDIELSLKKKILKSNWKKN